MAGSHRQPLQNPRGRAPPAQKMIFLFMILPIKPSFISHILAILRVPAHQPPQNSYFFLPFLELAIYFLIYSPTNP